MKTATRSASAAVALAMLQGQQEARLFGAVPGFRGSGLLCIMCRAGVRSTSSTSSDLR